MRALAACAALWLLTRLVLLLAGAEHGEATTLTVSGRPVAALVFRGASPRRTLVVAAHGGLASKETLAPLCWEARRRGADCVAVDLLGHGASGRLPAGDARQAMTRALHADRALGAYGDVRFVGHSLGALVGCGRAFPCERSVSIGQAVDCGPVIFGDVHRALGLPPSLYPLSHVLEPWTPTVIDRALSAALGPAHPRGTGRLAVTIALSWVSLAVAVAAGALSARRVRAAAWLPPWARGALGAAVTWAALALGAHRALWFLWPTQRTDALVLGAVVGSTLAVTAAVRAAGVRGPGWGVAAACAASLAVASASWLTFPARDLRGLLVLVPALLLPLCPAVALCERASRPAGADGVEAGVFAASLLGAFAALLLPALSAGRPGKDRFCDVPTRLRAQAQHAAARLSEHAPFGPGPSARGLRLRGRLQLHRRAPR